MPSTEEIFVREPTAEEDALVDAVMATHGQGAADVHATSPTCEPRGRSTTVT